MSDLTEFLLARIAEDEARVDVPDWHCTDSARGEGWGSRGEECPECGAYMFDGTESATEDTWEMHMADRHGRVLAESEAKRRIVELCGDQYEIGRGRLWSILTALATVYSDHPDCDEAWRP